ncbi:MAG TPA: hypothetical protein VH092_18905 [Urbifossiella sp.]|jgi:hypothetical protein|nr:hypothetical protein [Urbifossiella sp.]
MYALFVLLAAGPAQPPPVPLHCPTPVVARGEVKAGPPLAQAFELAHRAPAGALTITKIEAGCGCVRRGLSAEVLQPGETARLALEINTLTQPDGPNRWQVAVGYRLEAPGGPPQTGELLLTLTATLSREVVISPPQVGFSTTGTATQVLTVTDNRPMPLTITRAVASSPHLSAAVAPAAAGPDGVRRQTVTINLAAAAPAGHREETVVLQTDDPAYPEFRIPIRVLKRAAGGLVVTPESVAVRLVPGTPEVSALVQLRNADGTPVRVLHVQSESPEVTARWPEAAAPVTAIRVMISATRAGETRLRVRLAEPPGQELIIPVIWTGAGGGPGK